MGGGPQAQSGDKKRDTLQLLWTNRPFGLLWSARSVSLFGDSLTLVTLLLHIAETTDQALAVAFLLLVGDFVPAMLGPLTGTVSDRFNLKRLMVLCELAQGANPFARASALATVAAHLTAAPPTAAASEFLSAVVAKLLAKDPAQRFASAEELARVLDEAEEGPWWRGRTRSAPARDADVPPTRLRGKKCNSVSLLIIDEVGFQPMTRQEASLFFRLVSYRYGRGSTILTTNKAVKDWPEILAGDEVMATAMLDRLLHRAHVFTVRGNSYRLRDLERKLQ